MTLEEHIIYAQNLRVALRTMNCFSEETMESLDEAIKSLEQKPSEDAINRAAAIRLAEQGQVQGFEWQLQKLIALSPVTPTRKKGKWIINKEYNGYETIIKDCKCPFCEVEALLKKSYSMDGQRIVLYPSTYCPNCGAKLEVE